MKSNTDLFETGTVYGLFCPLTKGLRYIGSTKRPLKSRLAGHLSDYGIGDKHRWISELKKRKIQDKIEIEAIETDIPIHILTIKERKWIRHFLLLGCALTNSASNPDKKKRQQEVEFEGSMIDVPFMKARNEVIIQSLVTISNSFTMKFIHSQKHKFIAEQRDDFYGFYKKISTAQTITRLLDEYAAIMRKKNEGN